MSRRFATDIDLIGNKLLNALMNPLTSDPGSLGIGDEGRVWYNSTANTFKLWDGTAAIDLRSRATHTGVQPASTISDLAATVQAYRLDQFAAPSADVSLASHKLTNVTNPASDQDAATKAYVDTALAGLASGQVLKGKVRCAVTATVNLATPGSTLDGVTMAAGDVVLLTGQATASQNGPYVWSGPAAPLVRADNWNEDAEAVIGSYWIVSEGTRADNYALLTNDTPITLNTTALSFTFVGNQTYTAGNGIDITGSTISADPTTGIVVSGSGIGADFTIVGRKVAQVVPAATSGIFSVTGSTVIVNHGLNNAAPRVTVRAYLSPISPYATGQLVEVDEEAGDANNVTLTLPSAPQNNNWFVSVIG